MKSTPHPADHADPENRLLRAPLRTPADIPNLGPIRVRALAKAGFDSITALRGARVEDLTAVPGMSEVKARHIVTFLAATPDTLMADEQDAPPARATPASETEAVDPDAVERWLARLLARIIGLLLHAPAAGYRPRLLRELETFAQRSDGYALEATSLPPRSRDRAVRRMARLAADIDALGIPEALGRKEQAQLADLLEETADRLDMPKLAELRARENRHA